VESWVPLHSFAPVAGEADEGDPHDHLSNVQMAPVSVAKKMTISPATT